MRRPPAPSRAALTALLLAPACALAACSGASSSSAPAPADSAAQASADGAAPVSGALTVFAASSLKESFEEIGAALTEKNPGLTITYDFQGSQDLVSDLANGAEADVLATADERSMASATEQSLVAEPSEFATNRLALIVPPGNPGGITGLDPSLAGKDLVICADAVPCGNATNKLEEALGIALSPSSEEQRVTDVRAKVESGEADAGIVYKTDAAASGSASDEVTIPDGGVVNHYPLAVASAASNPSAARAFVDFVHGSEGQAILAEHGFGAPGQ
ncbi:ABC transporter component [Actinomyces sp. Chiba101]|uniref:molybdate ABC transporter substrate-binding protein n=1 Tax=Actinomyces TaxID=1654 RepID=UPI000974E427|nr:MULTISPECIES: molybdate ABC transporter substrate-binding protein [Actinomyces]BAW93732.1 ABC transporter component [Actinomyces sp. Chiba101]SUU74687.1 Molybdate-binding periplasmic protein precursor [Actinomyces denticolens]